MRDPFWVSEAPNISEIKHNEKKFTEEFSKTVIKHLTENFEVEICRDGFILMKIHQLETLRNGSTVKQQNNHDSILEFNSEYLSYLNTFQFLLASATSILQKFNYFRNAPISANEVFKVTKKNNEFDGASMPYRDISGHFLIGRYISSYNPIYPIEVDYRISRRSVIEEKVFHKCISDFEILFSDNDSFYIMSQINSSFSEFCNLNFRQCLTLAWFCIEYFINKTWVAFLHDKKKSGKLIDGDRRDILIGKDYSSSIMSNILELNGYVPYEIFVKINNVRSKRNLIVHNLDRVKKLSDVLKENPNNKKSRSIHLLDCLDSFDILKHFVKTYNQIEISFPIGFTYKEL